MGVVAFDGVPIGYSDGSCPQSRSLGKPHLSVPPAGRVEFVLNGPPEGVKAALITQAVETGPVYDNDSPPPPGPSNAQTASDDDNTPARTLATIVRLPFLRAPETASELPGPAAPEKSVASSTDAGTSPAPLSTVTPSPAAQILFFRESCQDPKDPNSPTIFYITEEGQEPTAYDPGFDRAQCYAYTREMWKTG